MFTLVTLNASGFEFYPLARDGEWQFKTMDELVAKVYSLEVEWTSLVITVLPPGERK